MNKKVLRFAGLIPAIGLVLTACGGSASKGNTNAATEVFEETNETCGDVSLRVWGAEEDAALLEQIITGFKAEYPDTTFNFTVEPMSEASCKDSILNAVLDAPDVFTFADDQLAALCASGLIKPIENAEDISKRNLEGAVEAATVNEKLCAYPLTADNGYFLYYNKKYLTDADVATMDALLAKASEAGKKVTMDCSSGWYLYSFFGNTGLTVGLNEDGMSNFCTWNATDGAIKGIDVMNAVETIGKNGAFLNGGDEALLDGAKNDTVIAGVSGVWMATQLEEVWGSNLGAVKLPTYTCAGQQVQMSSYAGYKLVGVNSYSPNAYWAAKFADYMSNEQNQTLRFQMRGQGPANINAANSSEVSSSVALTAVIQQSEFASLQRIGAAYWEAATELGTAMLSGNTDGLSKQTFLDKIVEKITASNS